MFGGVPRWLTALFILLAKIRCRLVGFRPVRKLIRAIGFVWETRTIDDRSRRILLYRFLPRLMRISRMMCTIDLFISVVGIDVRTV